jgi:methylglyoxal reductase
MGWSTAPNDQEAVEALARAHAAGVGLFDTADVYGHGRSERLLGRLVRQVDRDDLVLVSKVGYFAGTAVHGYEPAHMRHQLETTLTNLGTDHLDVYFLHHGDFGVDEEYLRPAVTAMNTFRQEGLIRAVGMRGPHRFAPDRLTDGPREDKTARFLRLFDVVRPQVLAVRDNLLTPPERSEALFAFAQDHGVGVLVNKVLGQGLLTGAYHPDRPANFGPGDHRLRKRWFTTPALAVIDEGLSQLRAVIGSTDRAELVRVACWSVLDRSPDAIVLAGFTRIGHVLENTAAVAAGPPPPVVLHEARRIMSEVQKRLDDSGEVFLDER